MYLADTMLEHTCRDFDALLEWQDEREKAWETGKISRDPDSLVLAF
jgi:hypothetical protein